MNDLKTLAELWKEAGEKPFDAVLLDAGVECRIHIVGISPDGIAVGWAPYKKHAWPANDREWRLAPPPPKKTRFWGRVLLFDNGTTCLEGYMANADLTRVVGRTGFAVEVTEGVFDD